MSARIASLLIAIVMLLGACSQHAPSEVRLREILRDGVDIQINAEREALASTAAGRMVIALSDLPSASEAKIEDIEIKKNETDSYGRRVLTVSYVVHLREDTFHKTSKLFLVKDDGNWPVVKII